jgi:hypothetical protein
VSPATLGGESKEKANELGTVPVKRTPPVAASTTAIWLVCPSTP